MFDKLRQSLFLRKQCQQAKREVSFPIYENVNSVLVIYDSDITEKNPDIREINRRLLQDNKQVTLLGYVDRKDVQSPMLPQSRMLGLKDTNWLQRLPKEIVKEIEKEEYDLLIDLTQQYCLPLHYAALLSRCRFKAGKHIIDGLHDLDIDMPATDSHTPLFDQIIYFLQTIKSNDKQ